MRWLADVVYFLAAMLYLPVGLYNAIFVGKNRNGWSQRFGRLPDFEPSPCRIWVHAVSLGEINATPRLVQSLLEKTPDASVVISTTTDTGYRRAVELYGANRVFRFPLDFSWVIRRAFSALQPALVVLVELEVWPNLVAEAARRGVPVVVVNGRFTARSARRLAWFGPAMRTVFSKLTWVGAQDEAVAARFCAAGVPSQRVSVTGSVKWDTALVADRVAGDAELGQAMGLDRSRPIWVCGSTGPGEEAILLDAHAEVMRDAGEEKSPRLALIPRKPERFDEVAALIESRGYSCVRRTRCPNGAAQPRLELHSVILGDTMGELRAFYSLADLVFVGRSLVPMGGSDPMEVAALAKPMIIGTHVDNFQQPVEVLRAGGSLEIVNDRTELVLRLRQWLGTPDLWKERGLRGRETVIANQGATEKTVSRLTQVLGESPRIIGAFQVRHSGVGSMPMEPYHALAPAARKQA